MQMQPWFGEEEKKAISNYMDEGGFITEYEKTNKFESLIKEYTKAKHCIVVNNGTVSLTLAALASGIKSGDDVIVPNYTMIATPNSVKFFGANPIFVDVDPVTFCLDIDLVKKAITSKTKAVILVTSNGRYPVSGIKPFEVLCKEKNLILIEDSAQSLGSFYPDGRHMGTVGHVGSFSFSAPKIISTGQGGAVITNNDEIALKLRKLKDFGRTEGGNDIHDTLGYNFKFTELQAVIGIEQIKKLPSRVKRKKEIKKMYQSLLKSKAGINLIEQDLTHTTPWFIDAIAEDRSNLQVRLKENNIGSRVMYPPINKQKVYDIEEEHKISNMIGLKGLWLPSSNQLTDEQIFKICEVINNYYA